MPPPGQLVWHGDALLSHARDGVHRALGSGAEFGHAYWDVTVPVSTDPRTHGELKRSWFDVIHDLDAQINLVIGATAKHAIFVEFGTVHMTAQAPLRGTAGEITAIMSSYLEQELTP